MKPLFMQFLHRLSRAAPDLPFAVRFWDGETVSFGTGSPAFVLSLLTPRAGKRILTDGVLGLGEEYMSGSIDVEGSFSELMHLGASAAVDQCSSSLLPRMVHFVGRFLSLNTLKRSPKNIAHHYSRGNDFYRLYLDRSLTYSCAYYRSSQDSLEQAQEQKYEHICRKLDLKAGESLLDIGCGWGGMLFHAARRHSTNATGCTLSVPQYDEVRRVVESEGLRGSVTVLLKDYRDLGGQFDKVVSIGMFEHVGKRYIPIFMRKMGTLLKPGGLGLLHTIGKDRPSRMNPWTMKYIFPGGYIPLLDEILRTMGKAGLIPTDVENLRLHYALTLEEWSRRFDANLKRIREMFDERFVRMWRMFLNGSAAGFRWGDSRLYQITFTNGPNNNLPLTREHLYAGG